MKTFWVTCLLIFAFSASQSQCLIDLTEYHLVEEMSDDFDYISTYQLLHGKGNTPAKWHSGHSYQSSFYKDAPINTRKVKYTWQGPEFSSVCANVNPENNYCYDEDDIELRQDPNDSSNKVVALKYTYHEVPIVPETHMKYQYHKTSGLLESENTLQYGIIEIRCKVPSYDGLQAAFWLWAGKDPSGNPREIDGFETLYEAHEGKRKYFATIQPNLSTFYTWKNDPANDYHIYHIAWTPGKISWFVDGYEIRTDTKNNIHFPLSIELSGHYIYSCLVKGIEGQNDYCVTKTCKTPNDPFLIDYIKVYKPNTGDVLPYPEYKTTQNAWADFNVLPPGNLTDPNLNGGTLPSQSVVLGTGASTRIYFVRNNTLYFAYPATASDLTQNWFIDATTATNVNPNSKLAVNNINNTLFYVSDTGSLYEYLPQNNAKYDMVTHPAYDSRNPRPYLESFDVDATKDIAYDEVNRRVYYVSTLGNGHTLKYYDIPGASWQKRSPGVTNVGQYLQTCGGVLYYQDINNDLYAYGNYGSGWYTNTLNLSGVPDDITSNFAVDKSASRIYFLSSTGKLRYYEHSYSTSPYNWTRHEETAINYISATSPMYANGKLFSISNSKTVDKYNAWNGVWGNSPLNDIVGRNALRMIGETEADKVFYYDANGAIHLIRYGSCETLNPPVSSTTYTNLRPALATNDKATSAATRIEIYPNPSQDQFTIQLSSDQRISDVTVMDIMGKVCLTQKAAGNSAVVDVQGLKAGVYYCRLRLNNGAVVSRSIVVQR